MKTDPTSSHGADRPRSAKNGGPTDPAHKDASTVLDRVQMPPMSGDEALRRFQTKHGQRVGVDPAETAGTQSELDALSPLMRLVALGGTLLLIVALLLGGLFLMAVQG